VSATPIYLGIDVACASNKRLPICAVTLGSKIEPLEIRWPLLRLIPRGRGNREITEVAPFRDAARDVARAIAQIAREMGWCIQRIAIDAPAAPPKAGARVSEAELGRCGLSSFRTPAEPDWAGIRETCIRHLDADGALARLPHANKIWMMFGFELFASLREESAAEVIEVYPFAIVRALLPSCEHKSMEQGYRAQLAAVAARTGWDPGRLEQRLKGSVSGSRHDRLDAFMAAWVASLPPGGRRPYGDAQQPDDSIWVPV
jgi:hypothetical protein